MPHMKWPDAGSYAAQLAKRVDASGYSQNPAPRKPAAFSCADDNDMQWYAYCESKIDQWLTEADMARRAGDSAREKACMENAEYNAKCAFKTPHPR